MLNSQAEVIRGKINLLSWVLDKPIEVRVVLTHLDDLAGYSDFVGFAEKTRMGLSLPLESDGSGQLRCSACPRNSRISSAFCRSQVTRLPARQYRGIPRFCRRHQRTCLRSHVFSMPCTRIDRSPSRPSPAISTSPRRPTRVPHRHALRSSPAQTRGRSNPLLIHEIAAVLLIALPLGHFSAGYYLERKLWQSAETTLLTYAPAALSDVDEQRARAKIARFTQRDANTGAGSWFPSFFRAADLRVNDRLAQT